MPARMIRLRVGACSRNAEFDLGARIQLAPNFQTASDELRPFAHASQSPMPGRMIPAKNDRIDPFSVVQDPDPQVMFVIPYLHFNSPGRSVPDRVSQRLRTYSIRFVTNDGIKNVRRSFNLNTKFGNG